MDYFALHTHNDDWIASAFSTPRNDTKKQLLQALQSATTFASCARNCDSKGLVIARLDEVKAKQSMRYF